MKKLSNLLGFLALGFVLPLSVQASLLANWKIATLMAAAAVLVLTQPAITLDESEKNTATDRRSLWAIVLLSLPSIIVPVTDWAFFQPFFARKTCLDHSYRVWGKHQIGQFSAGFWLIGLVAGRAVAHHGRPWAARLGHPDALPGVHLHRADR